MKLYELLILIFTLCTGVAIGSLGKTQSSTTYNNTQAVTECATTLNRCMEGWRETLDTLNSCNNLIK